MVKLINRKEKNKINLYLMGDLHVGIKTCNKKAILKTIDIIAKDKYAKVILMGDLGDYVSSDDTRRYDPFNVDSEVATIEKQVEWITKQFKRIKHKIYGILRGNHEATYAKYHMDEFVALKCRDFAEVMAKDLNTEYLEDMAILKLLIGKHPYNIMVTHGTGGTASLSGQLRTLNNIILSFKRCPDILAMGHVHTLQTVLNPKMNFNFDVEVKHLAFTGTYYQSYIKGNINYASSNLYNPLTIGCVMYSLNEKGEIQDNKLIFN